MVKNICKPETYLGLADRSKVFRLPTELEIDHNCKTILRVVSEYYGEDQADVKSHNRQKNLVTPRHVSMYLMNRLYNNTTDAEMFEQIGDRFGRNHATVIHAKRSVENQLKYDKKYKEKFEGVQKLLRGSYNLPV